MAPSFSFKSCICGFPMTCMSPFTRRDGIGYSDDELDGLCLDALCLVFLMSTAAFQLQRCYVFSTAFILVPKFPVA